MKRGWLRILALLGGLAALWLAPEGQFLLASRALDSAGCEPPSLQVVATSPWRAPQYVFPEGGRSAARSPTLLADPLSGIMHLAWEEASQVRYASRSGDTWELDPTVFAGDSPSMTLSPDGTPHLAYVSLSLSTNQLQVFHVRRQADGWGLPHVVSGTSGPSTEPDISVIVSGTIHIVWAERLDRANRIYHACSSDQGLTWTPMLPIPGAMGFAPALAIGADNHVWVAWQADTGSLTETRSDILVARWDGLAWSSPEDISRTETDDARSPTIITGPDGQARLTWEQESSVGERSCYLAEGDLGRWSAPLKLSIGMAARPTLLRGLADTLYVAWDAGSTLEGRVESPLAIGDQLSRLPPTHSVFETSAWQRQPMDRPMPSGAPNRPMSAGT